MANASETVAAVVRVRVENAGIKPHALAVSTGIPNSTLTRRLKGVAPGFTIDELAAIADVLHTTPVEILIDAARSAA